ncbi:hypothetical protein F2Q69_00018961 [Brassica cretica]|uniref:Uncharacterized protein n=1 Tax=Brassica cretica TaxID=69181 RepID=A0A8S9QQF7_BRACR|nr:hypothetical protein F2Q69_00018961 [Brassica cretica]
MLMMTIKKKKKRRSCNLCVQFDTSINLTTDSEGNRLRISTADPKEQHRFSSCCKGGDFF